MSTTSPVTVGLQRGVLLGLLGAFVTRDPSYLIKRLVRDTTNEVVNENNNKAKGTSSPKSQHPNVKELGVS